MPDDTKTLELRIAELEKKLSAVTQRTTANQLTKEEIEAFHKVREVIAADWGDFCGINDCFRCVNLCVSRCIVNTRCIVRCVNECVCGPCNVGDVLGGGGIGRFGTLGG